MAFIIHALHDIALHVKRQALFRPPRGKMHMAAHPPQKILAAFKQPQLLGVEQSDFDKLGRQFHAIGIFGNPVQRVEITQAAFAVLDIGLDQIARSAGARDALFAFRQFGRHEFRGCSDDNFLVKAAFKAVKQSALADQKTRLKQSRADGHIRAPFPDTFFDGAGGMTDLQLQIPQRV